MFFSSSSLFARRTLSRTAKSVRSSRLNWLTPPTPVFLWISWILPIRSSFFAYSARAFAFGRLSANWSPCGSRMPVSQRIVSVMKLCQRNHWKTMRANVWLYLWAPKFMVHFGFYACITKVYPELTCVINWNLPAGCLSCFNGYSRIRSSKNRYTLRYSIWDSTSYAINC